MLLQAGVRQRWKSWLALSLLTALVVGLVLAGAFFYSVDPVTGVAALPSVASAIAVRTPISGTPRCACSRPINVDDFTVEEVPPGQLSEVSKPVAGSLQPSNRVRSSKVSRRTTTRAVPSETKTTAGRGTLL
jgi:hypothetical protein